jgi:L-alanine-DL-glutamate epimerase-like enolase superfamily enzyme
VTVRLLEARLRGALIGARVPFRFGIAEMREIVHVVLFATVEVDGSRVTGVAADNLPPKWFTKNPETSYRQDVEEMIEVVESAGAAAVRGGRHDSVFDLWDHVYREQVARGDPGIPPLLAGFGVSVVERAVIDAFCRARATPFADAVRANELGIRLGSLHPELAGRKPRELLPEAPLRSMRIRHTVGLGDALSTGDDAGAAPPDDLPSTLEAWIRRHGLRRFKVKVGGDARADLDRLERIQDVLHRETRGDYGVTIDGNEQFADVSALREFWEGVTARRGTAELARRIDYVEQPLPRHLALSAETSAALAAWPGRPDLIVDESDDSLDAVARAIEAGYEGGAFKSSKGVFKGIGNACRVEQLRREDPGRRLVYSAEDSSTIEPVGLLADLAVVATLGIDEPERNGYHYLRGLTGLPPRVDEETIRHHGDLFTRHADGRAALSIREGAIEVGSVVAAPFGVGWPCDFEEDLDGAGSVAARLG